MPEVVSDAASFRQEQVGQLGVGALGLANKVHGDVGVQQLPVVRDNLTAACGVGDKLGVRDDADHGGLRLRLLGALGRQPPGA